MLSEILKAFRRTDEPMDLNRLSRELGTDRSALEGMLETLVRQGKLKEINIGGETCGNCHGKASCGALHSGMIGKVYELADEA
jgi:hypothetical protein